MAHSIRPIDGKENYSIRKWIGDFEEIAELTKKNYEVAMKKMLIAEFQVIVISAPRHKMLMIREKRRDEPVQEY